MVVTEQQRPDRTSFGVTLVVIAVFLMSIQDTLIKHFSADVSLWQLFTLRGSFAVPLLIVAAIATGRRREIWSGAIQKWSMMRSALLVLMLAGMYASLPFLSLSVVAAGIYTGPVFVTLLSAYAINEPVGARGWFAIALGFTGVLVILQPGTDAFSYWTLVPVFGGFLYASSNIITRSKCQSVTPAALSLSLQMGFLLAGVGLSAAILWWTPSAALTNTAPFILSAWSSISTTEWLLFAGLAVFAIAVSMSLAGAYQNARPSVVATFDYSYLVFVALWDYLIFATAPSGSTTLGITLIVLSGLLVLRR
jgi:drug/metabolite transporter (DMT)-like permease